MQTIEVSDEVYQKLLARRIGRESISTVISRELREPNTVDIAKLDADFERARKNTPKPISHEEVFKGV